MNELMTYYRKPSNINLPINCFEVWFVREMLPYMLLVLYFSYGIASRLGHAFRQKLLRETTGVTQLPLLKRSRAKSEKIKGTAVVCGGGLVFVIPRERHNEVVS
jgi:hypothetical protein